MTTKSPSGCGSDQLSRRALLSIALSGGAAVLSDCKKHGHAAAESAVAAAPSASRSSAAEPPFAPLNRFPTMVHEYFVQQVRAAEEVGNRRRAAVDSPAAAEAYVRDVRARIQRALGPWPAKTPLKPRVVGVLRKPSYRIEKVIFESRPNFPVTANLYVPKAGGRRPGVVVTCGHSGTAKASRSYQTCAQALARMGYVALIFDPVSQGERAQILTDGKPVSGTAGVSEHTRLNGQLALVGQSTAAWEIWDGVRAIDYLLTRTEVDPRHIGVVGNSGGGTQTTWLAGVDARITMAAPSCFVTTFRRNLENQVFADGEQYPPFVLAEGLDHSDFLAAMAPKPVLLLGRDQDDFDVRGLEESYERLRALYRQLNAEDHVSLYVGRGSHGFYPDNRVAVYRWFNRFTKVSAAREEPQVALETMETLACTHGGVMLELKPANVPALIAERTRALAAYRARLSGEALRQAVKAVLRLPERNGVPDYRILRPLPGRGYPTQKFATYLIESEPGIQAVVYLLANPVPVGPPRRGPSRAVLYVAHDSSDVELREETLLRELVEKGDAPVYTCDTRGTGESHPNTRLPGITSAELLYAAHGMMLGRPYVGQRTHDVLCVLDWLKSLGHEQVHLIGKGRGAVAAAFAALSSDTVTQVTLKNGLTSFNELAVSEFPTWVQSEYPFGVLQYFDLPDCYRELASKGLQQIEPMGPQRQPRPVKFL